MKRNLRRSIDIGLTITGVIIIFGSILYGAYISLEQQLMQVIVGVMLMEAGVWRLSNKILHTTAVILTCARKAITLLS